MISTLKIVCNKNRAFQKSKLQTNYNYNHPILMLLYIHDHQLCLALALLESLHAVLWIFDGGPDFLLFNRFTLFLAKQFTVQCC